MIWRNLIVVAWLILTAYWWLSALKTRRTIIREPGISRYGVLLIEILGYILLFTGWAQIDGLDRRVVHRTYALEVFGVALTWIGVGLALWARRHLGQYWSARVALKEDHRLIRTGPYACFRHPIYSGFDLAALGTALAIDRRRCFVGLVLIVLGYWIKARTEESMLSAQFGPEFQEHRRRTGFLIPKFW
jgi:protein-S-isoprenylcysteine O-methyltransferase Ste14